MTFRVHAETTKRDSDVFAMPLMMGQNTAEIFVEKMPIITEREVKAIYPFESPAGGFGCYFKLDLHGSNAWEQMTSSLRDRFIIVMFNGRPLARLRIDRPVTDGIVMVPSGISPQEILLMGKRYVYIGETLAQAEKRRKIEQKTLKAR